MTEPRRDHNLGANKAAIGGIFLRRRGDEIAVCRIREIKLAAAACGKVVQPRLDRRRIVGNAIALRAEVANAKPSLRCLFVNLPLLALCRTTRLRDIGISLHCAAKNAKRHHGNGKYIVSGNH